MTPAPLRHIYQRIRATFPCDYKIGDYAIKLPSHHRLPGYQQEFPLYDRFLPVLAKHISFDKLIIDVGANVGDTTIAIMQNCKNPIYAFEPDPVFYDYLLKNVYTSPLNKSCRVTTFKRFVGTGNVSSRCIPLDSFIDTEDVVLLKIDVDGFDYDVINSAGSILSRSEPILFWENWIDTDRQFEGFCDMYKHLSKQGYCYLYLIDNYGNLLLKDTDFRTLIDINNYLYTLKKSGARVPFDYIDVLAVTEKYRDNVRSAIREYEKLAGASP